MATTDPYLTEKKARSIEADGYERTGVILLHPVTDTRAVVELGKVTWSKGLRTGGADGSHRSPLEAQQEIDRLTARLRRLAFPKSILEDHPATDEELARMNFARFILQGKDASTAEAFAKHATRHTDPTPALPQDHDPQTPTAS